MLLDLRNADLGHEFKIVGGRWDGEHGLSADYWYMEGEDFNDEFEIMTENHVRTDLGPVATYKPEGIWSRMRGS